MRVWSLLLLLPTVAHAEVMDKEPSLAVVLAVSVLASLLGFLSARFKPIWLWLVVPAGLLWLGSSAWESMDPFVGPAIVAEAGMVPAAAPWAGLLVFAASVLLGVWRRRCAPNNSSKPTPLRGAA